MLLIRTGGDLTQVPSQNFYYTDTDHSADDRIVKDYFIAISNGASRGEIALEYHGNYLYYVGVIAVYWLIVILQQI